MRQHLSNHLNSYKYAASGIFQVLKSQSNIWIQVPIGIFVLLAAYYFRVTVTEWLILILTIGFVLAAELFNTALEAALSFLTEEYRAKVKVAKDVAAGAVLVAALASVAVGIIIFAPRMLRM